MYAMALSKSSPPSGPILTNNLFISVFFFSCASFCTDVRAFMLFANGKQLYRINFDGTGFQSIYFNFFYGFLACDFDFATNYVYYAALDLLGSPFIGRIPIVGGAGVKIVSTGVGYVESLEVDYLHRKLIWIDSR